MNKHNTVRPLTEGEKSELRQSGDYGIGWIGLDHNRKAQDWKNHRQSKLISMMAHACSAGRMLKKPWYTKLRFWRNWRWK